MPGVYSVNLFFSGMQLEPVLGSRGRHVRSNTYHLQTLLRKISHTESPFIVSPTVTVLEETLRKALPATFGK